MEIRKYREEDTAAIVSLFRNTVRKVKRRDYTEEPVEAWAPDDIDPELWKGSLSSDFTVVAEDEGKIVGFGDIDDCGYLDRLYVAADRQGEGIASEIYEKIEEYARVIGVLEITTEASVTAKPFFLAKGFSVRREQVKRHNGCDFVNYVMAKEI